VSEGGCKFEGKWSKREAWWKTNVSSAARGEKWVEQHGALPNFVKPEDILLPLALCCFDISERKQSQLSKCTEYLIDFLILTVQLRMWRVDGGIVAIGPSSPRGET
jgi:hypothetical protein